MTKTQLFLRILLPLHLVGLILMAGTTLFDYYCFKTAHFLHLASKFGLIIRTGAITLILTGIAMLTIAKDSWSQPLFKLKLALTIIVFLHGMLIGSRRVHLNRFYPIQLTLFFIIILVSINIPHHPNRS